MFNITQQQEDTIRACYEKAVKLAKDGYNGTDLNPNSLKSQTPTRRIFNDLIDDNDWVCDLKSDLHDWDKTVDESWDIVGNKLWNLVADPTRRFAKGEEVNQ